MEIEDAGEITKFETMPTETMLYLTAVCYSHNYWSSGPSGYDKQAVLASLGSWSGITKARIYGVKVPINGLEP